MIMKSTLQKARTQYRRKHREMRFPYEAYMNKNRLIFIHIPRSGGTAIRSAFGAPTTGRLHITWYIYYQANPVKYNRFYKFTFFRDPIARAYSAYRHLCRGGNRMNNWRATETIRSFQNFPDFVRNGLTTRLWQRHTLFLPQTYFICDYTLEPQVDFIGCTEKMDEDANQILSKFNVKTSLKQLNTAPEPSMPQDSFDTETKEIIESIYASDFELLNQIKRSYK